MNTLSTGQLYIGMGVIMALAVAALVIAWLNHRGHKR